MENLSTYLLMVGVLVLAAVMWRDTTLRERHYQQDESERQRELDHRYHQALRAAAQPSRTEKATDAAVAESLVGISATLGGLFLEGLLQTGANDQPAGQSTAPRWH